MPVIVQTEHIDLRCPWLEPINVALAHSVGEEPFVQFMPLIYLSGDQIVNEKSPLVIEFNLSTVRRVVVIMPLAALDVNELDGPQVP